MKRRAIMVHVLSIAWCAASSGALQSCGASDSSGASSTQPAELAPEARVELTVYAATSLRDVLSALADPFERAHGVKLTFNYGSSGDLSRQIVAARGADLFFSADEAEMDRVERAGLVLPGSRRSLVSNRLAVIEHLDAEHPASSVFRTPFTFDQLAQPGLEHLSLGNPDTVPAGKYAKALLQQRGVWESVQAKVLPGVDVRAALAAVESGGALVGMVYTTDAARSTKVRVVHVVPADEGPRISYPVCVLGDRPHTAEASAWCAFLISRDGRAAFERSGFVVLEGAQ